MCLRCETVDSGVSSVRSPAVKLETAKAVVVLGRVSSSVDEVIHVALSRGCLDACFSFVVFR